jgi:hypothetical protein
MVDVHRDARSFETWADEHSGFEDAMVRSIVPASRDVGASPPEQAELELAYQVGGGYRAGDVRTLRRVRLTFRGLERFGFDSARDHFTDHWSQGLEPLQSESPIAFAIDTPGRLIIEASAVEIENLPDWQEEIAPWESEREVFLVLSGDLPTPERLLDLCVQETGIDVCWRVYGGEEQPAGEVPMDGYDGWFLQQPKHIHHCRGGVMLGIGQRGSGASPVRMTLTNVEPDGNMVLWAVVLQAFASLGIASAHCGNRELDADAFRELVSRKLAEVGLRKKTTSPE